LNFLICFIYSPSQVLQMYAPPVHLS